MRASPIFKASHHAVPSPDGAFVASISNQSVVFQFIDNSEIRRTISISPSFSARISFVRWSPLPSSDELETNIQRRVLVADTETIRVWDIENEDWTAVINNAGGSMGKVANVGFGRNSNEILVFTEFGVKLTVWFLDNGRNVEIKDPKFATRGFSYRPNSGHFALLARPAAHDIVTLHEPGNYSLLKSFAIPTVDAQGLKWSPCGRWISIWDAPSSGYRVLIYTPEGHLFRTYTGRSVDESINLGVKSVEWSACGGYLAIGGYDGKVTMLQSTTFSPAMSFTHVSTVDLSSVIVWQELVSSNERVYSLAPQPMSPPLLDDVADGPSLKNAVSIIAFSLAESGLVATRVDSMPTTVWIWSLQQKHLLTALVHHSPVKSISWHPTIPGLLMTQCSHDDGIIYLWEQSENRPRIYALPLDTLIGKYGAQWVNAQPPNEPVVILNDSQSYVVGFLGDEAAAEPNTDASEDASRETHKNSLFEVDAQQSDNLVPEDFHASSFSEVEVDMTNVLAN